MIDPVNPALLAVNSKITGLSPVPTTPTILTSAPLISTPNYAGGVSLISAAEQQAMVSQQALTNTVVAAQAKLGDVTNSAINVGNEYAASILPGPAGMTTGQLASSVIGKPGSTQAMNYLIQNGAEPEKIMTSLSSGPVLEQATQVGVVADSMVKTTNNLINVGAITGGENPPEVAGIIAAGSIGSASSALGGISGSVTGALGSIGGSVTGALGGAGSALSNIGSSISSGAGSIIASGAKAATALAGGLTGAIPGLTSSVGGLAKSIGGLASGIPGAAAIGGGVASLTAGLQSTFKSAFSAVESSYKNLKGGMPNTLGGNGESTTATNITSPSNQYNIAAAEVLSAEDNLFAAKKAFRNENTPETTEALRKAEQALSQARQNQFAASKAFISGAASSVTGIFSSSNPVTTANSGLNILPGGMGAIVSQVGGLASSALTSLKGAAGGAASSVGSVLGNISGSSIGASVGSAIGSITSSISGSSIGASVGSAIGSITSSISGSSIGTAVSSVVGQITSSLSNPGALVGNLLGNTGKAITGLLGSAGGAATGLLSSLKTGLSSLGPAANGVKPAVAAVGTFDKTAIAAKTGQLMGDVKIPNPTQAFSNISANITTPPDQIVEKVKQSIGKLNMAEDELKKQKLKVEASLADYLTNETADNQKKYEAEYAKYQALQKSSAVAQVEYEVSIYGGS
jgi:hypothetical protein